MVHVHRCGQVSGEHYEYRRRLAMGAAPMTVVDSLNVRRAAAAAAAPKRMTAN